MTSSSAPPPHEDIVLYTCPHCHADFPAEDYVIGDPAAPTLSDRCSSCRYEEQSQMQALLAAQVIDADAAALAAGAPHLLHTYVGGGEEGAGPHATPPPAPSPCPKCGRHRAGLPAQGGDLDAPCMACLRKETDIPSVSTPEPKRGGTKQGPLLHSERDASPGPLHSKTCMHCGLDKEVSAFRGSKNKTDRLQNRCRECELALGRGAKRDRCGPVVVRVAHKLCRRCGEVKGADLFFHSKLSLDGICTYCKACQKELNKQARAKRPEVLKPQVEEKECRHCGFMKPADQYFRSRMNLDGLYSYCRSCATVLNTTSKKRRRAQLRQEKGGGRAESAAPLAERPLLLSPDPGAEAAAGHAPLYPATPGFYPQYHHAALDARYHHARGSPHLSPMLLQEYAVLQAMAAVGSVEAPASGVEASATGAAAHLQAALAMQLAALAGAAATGPKGATPAPGARPEGLLEPEEAQYPMPPAPGFMAADVQAVPP